MNVEITSPVDYGTVQLEPKVSLFDSDTGINYGTFSSPRTFESLQLYSGFMLYETSLPTSQTRPRSLEVQGIHDRATVYLDKVPAGIVNRSDNIQTVSVSETGEVLYLLVENMGHINDAIKDLKGITGSVALNGEVLRSWKHTGYPMTNVTHVAELPGLKGAILPAFYSGTFILPQSEESPKDTFVDMTGWGKGVLYVNGINLGRYWPKLGPQITLYLPGPFLQQKNTFTILELEEENPSRTINLVSTPILNRLPSAIPNVNKDSCNVDTSNVNSGRSNLNSGKSGVNSDRYDNQSDTLDVFVTLIQ